MYMGGKACAGVTILILWLNGVVVFVSAARAS